MEIFQDMEGLVLKRAEIYVEIQYMELILGMEVKHHTPYCTNIGRRKQLCNRSYKLYAYGIH